MMKKWIVYTDNGDYTDVFAFDERGAMDYVYLVTMGRANPYMAREVRNG